MTGVRRIPFGIGNQVIRLTDAVTSRRIGRELVSKGRLIKQSKVVKDDEAEAIAQAITARKGGERFGFYKDMGGYFPTPPRGWPPTVNLCNNGCYARGFAGYHRLRRPNE